MKSLVLQALGRLELAETAIPELQPDELLIRTGATTICTSDINDIRENPFDIQLPVVLGHEAAGTVAAVGGEVKGFKTGDRVATHPVHPCGSCQPCQDGLGHLCLNLGHFGLNMPGTFAEYYRVRQDRARHIPEGVDFAVASLAEPVCVCLEALGQARLQAGQSLLVLGDGPFGVLMTRLAARLGMEKVVIAGTFDTRLAFAQAAAPVNISAVKDRLEAMRLANSGQNFDAAILAVGSERALRDGLQCLKPRGRMVIFSALPGSTPVDLFSLHIHELEIVGACSDQERFDEAVLLLSDPQLRLEELITHRFTLEAYRQAFETAEHAKAETMKVAFLL